MTYNHLIDVAFTVEGPWEQLEDIPMEVLLAALQKRIDNIRQENTIESFGLCDTYEVEQ
jgi:hypothetical protein